MSRQVDENKQTNTLLECFKVSICLFFIDTQAKEWEHEKKKQLLETIWFSSKVFVCFLSNIQPIKGQLISKAIYGLLNSHKKQTDECLLFYSSQQTNQIRPFVFWGNLQLANLLFDFF